MRRTWGLLGRCAVAVVATALLAGCSDPAPRGGTVSESPSAPSASDTSPPSAPAPSTPTSTAGNDLAGNKASRSLKADPITASVDYSTTLPIGEWRPQGIKPLRISLTAVNNSSRGQKIYLSRVTASVTSYDVSGPVDGPRALTDTANVGPGYYVTFPTEYGQTLLLPSVVPSAIRLTVDFTYEFVAQVSEDDPTSAQRDFAKQTATDRLSIPLSQ